MLFIHLSDIHFKKKDVVQLDDDPNAGLRDDIINDVRFMHEQLGRSADAILISGDVAFSGASEEYDFAYKWLEGALCPAAGCAIEDVFVIPGNHDVDRNQAAAPLHQDARDKLRDYEAAKVDNALRAYMRDKTSAQLLFAPIENYNRFAAKFVCSIGAYDEKHKVTPYACRSWPMNDGSTIKVWGFNSVLISDINDNPNKMFVDPAGAQIQRGEGAAHVVMCHHPYGWLKNGGAFRERIEEVAQLHLFGHEHTRRVEPGKHFTTIRAGAMQPDRDEPGWDPGYNWIDLSVSQLEDKRYLDVQIWVRKREGASFIAVPDRDHKDPWEIRHPLPSWSAPRVVSVPKSEGVSPMTTPSAPVNQTSQPSGRLVTSKLFRLAEHAQRQIIVGLALDQDGDQGLKDYEFVLAAVKRAKDRGRLSELNQKVDEALGNGDGR